MVVSRHLSLKCGSFASLTPLIELAKYLDANQTGAKGQRRYQIFGEAIVGSKQTYPKTQT
jgi:hypothetical protein